MALPLFGNTLQYARDPLGYMTESLRRHGDVVYSRVLGMETYLLGHPEDIEQVLLTRGKQYVKGFRKERAESPFGQGLLLSDGAVWQRQRRLVQPAFHRPRMAEHAPVMVDVTRRMVESWQDGEVRQLDREMMRLTLRIFLETLVGAEGHDMRRLEETFTVLSEEYERLLRSPVQLPDWLPLPGRMRFGRALGYLKGRIASLTRGTRPTEGLLSALLASQDDEGGMSEQLLQDEVLSLFLAGHETTALNLTYTCYLLARHPEVEALLVEEVRRVLGDRPATYDDLPALSYASKVITESLRLYPPVYAMVREPLEDDELRGYRIPRGSLVVLPQWVVHRDRRYFEAPDDFRPERWTEEFERSLPRFAYFPFGGGQRLCIGNHFALVEATLVLVTMVQRFCVELVSNEPLELSAAVTMRPKRGLRMRLRQHHPSLKEANLR